ncbi:MAG: hypothetical protein ACLR8P_18215 [Clostridium fessum]
MAISQEAPTAMAPALKARSVLAAASAMASLLAARTRVSITTSSGDYIDEITAFCDNRMNPDVVIIPEGFTLVSHGGKSEGGCILMH